MNHSRASDHQSAESGRVKSGAAFGATLYCDFVLSCATKCGADNKSISFILKLLFCAVQRGAGKCSITRIST
jgi:hypothetical protein